MKTITSIFDWLRAKVEALRAAHNESATNIFLRVTFAFLTWKFMGDLWDAGSLTLWAERSNSRAIAALLGGDVFGWTFLALMLGLTPFAVSGVCWWANKHRGLYARIAMATFGISGALYILLAMNARNTDLAVIRMTYARTGAECIVMMLLIGTMLNAQLRRAHGLDDFESESNRVPLI